MRAVVDTNILVRAVIMPHGTVDPVLLRLRNGGYAFLYSEGTLTELVDVLNRPRLRDKYGLTDADTRTVVGSEAGEEAHLLRVEVARHVERLVALTDGHTQPVGECLGPRPAV